jgi:hypothetical protein
MKGMKDDDGRADDRAESMSSRGEIVSRSAATSDELSAQWPLDEAQRAEAQAAELGARTDRVPIADS